MAEKREQEIESFVTAYDDAGRPVKIPKKEFAERVLPELFKQAWNDAASLGRLVLVAVEEGLADRALLAAERLGDIDPDPARSTGVRAQVAGALNDLGAAQELLEGFLAKHGDHPAVTAELARILLVRGQVERAEELIAAALARDPNAEGPLALLASKARVDGGHVEAVRVLAPHAKAPGAWKPQLLMARAHLEGGDLPAALRCYRESIEASAGHPDAYAIASADLGQAGKLAEMVELLAGYDPARHGAAAGLNLARALAALGRKDEALSALARLESGNDPALAQAIEGLRRQVSGEAPAGQVSTVAVAIPGPLWTRGLLEPTWLLPPKSPDAAKILFFLFADTTVKDEAPTVESSRLTRALPLYLAEAVHLRSTASASAVIPTLQGGTPIVSGQPFTLRSIRPALQGLPDPDVIVCGFLSDGPLGLAIEVDLWTFDGAPLGRLRVDVPDDWEGLMGKLEESVLGSLREHGFAEAPPFPGPFATPPPEHEGRYALALDHLFAHVCGANGLRPVDSLANERRMLEIYFALAEQDLPGYPAPSILALSGVACAQKIGSSSVEDFLGRLRGLAQKAKSGPFAALAPLALKRAGDAEGFEILRKTAAADEDASEAYLEWLGRVAGA